MIFVSVSYFTIFNPIAYRIEYSVDSFRDGDMSAATSNRSNLADTYWEEYSQNSIVEVVLGTFKLHNKIKNISYAHNSYIGFFFYFGFIGMAFFLYVILKRILYLKGRDCFYPSLLTKVILLIAGLTVSMETTSFWNSFLFL